MPRLELLEAPALPEPVRDLVKRARSGLLLVETIRRSIALIGAAAGLAAVLVAVGRFVVLPWAEPVAAGLVIASMLAALVISLIFRASPGRAALAVDRRLGGSTVSRPPSSWRTEPITALKKSANFSLRKSGPGPGPRWIRSHFSPWAASTPRRRGPGCNTGDGFGAVLSGCCPSPTACRAAVDRRRDRTARRDGRRGSARS